jgi:hypothetical protein
MTDTELNIRILLKQLKGGFIMASVTQRIASIKQPYGGYIPPKTLTVTQLQDNKRLHPLSKESVHLSVMGLMVDYMTRYMLFRKPREAFDISLQGAYYAGLALGNPDVLNNVMGYVDHIKGLDDMSLTYARQAIKGDCWRRTGYGPVNIGDRKYHELTSLDRITLHNAKVMINRSLNFAESYGPITCSEFTFGDAYTHIVDSGDGDFLTGDCLWDFKVSVKKPTKAHTLQILMYFILGKHSKKPEFKDIDKIGIFNPRLNTVFQMKISDIDKDILNQVEFNVIGYHESCF